MTYIRLLSIGSQWREITYLHVEESKRFSHVIINIFTGYKNILIPVVAETTGIKIFSTVPVVAVKKRGDWKKTTPPSITGATRLWVA